MNAAGRIAGGITAEGMSAAAMNVEEVNGGVMGAGRRRETSAAAVTRAAEMGAGRKQPTSAAAEMSAGRTTKTNAAAATDVGWIPATGGVRRDVASGRIYYIRPGGPKMPAEVALAASARAAAGSRLRSADVTDLPRRCIGFAHAPAVKARAGGQSWAPRNQLRHRGRGDYDRAANSTGELDAPATNGTGLPQVQQVQEWLHAPVVILAAVVVVVAVFVDAAIAAGAPLRTFVSPAAAGVDPAAAAAAAADRQQKVVALAWAAGTNPG
jgi:hypothetical protein